MIFIRKSDINIFMPISHEWRHLDAILFFFTFSRLIDHIFITKYHFWNSFGRHKLKVGTYRQVACMIACASRRAHTRASKFQNAQNSILIKREYMSDNLEHFKNFRACAFLRASYARTGRTDGRNSVFLGDIDSWYIKDWYSFIYNHFWQITRSCELVKVRNPRARLWANTCKNNGILCWAIAPQNAR